MITQIYSFKNLPSNYKTVLNQTLKDEQLVYVVKTNDGIPKSITTSVTQAVQKTQHK